MYREKDKERHAREAHGADPSEVEFTPIDPDRDLRTGGGREGRSVPYRESHLDQEIGSVLEAWTTRDTGEYCRFCANEHVGDAPPEERFCSDDCREDFQKVLDARITIGERDLELRGFD